MLSNLIPEFKSFEKTKQDEIKLTEKLISEYEVIIIDFTADYKAINFFKRLFAFDKRKQLKDIKAFIKNKKKLAAQQAEDILNKKLLLHENYVNQLIMSNKENNTKYDEINARIQLATDLYNAIHKTKKAGDYVLEEIEEAISAINSAESMETLDMFSKNKGISLMSSMSTSTARSEVEDVAPAIDQFKKELEHTRLKVNEVQFNSMWTTLDFFFDMSDNGFMDTFSSFMVLNSLSNTESQLITVNETIKKIMNAVNKDHDEIYDQLKNEKKTMETFLEHFKIKTTADLNAADIKI